MSTQNIKLNSSSGILKTILTLNMILISFVSINLHAQEKRIAQNDREKQIVMLFDDIKKQSKGALDLNTYQTVLGRMIVATKNPTTGKSSVMNGPPGTLMTVAFRTQKATQLTDLNFYLGNRYASNYLELRNKYLETPELAAQMKQQLVILPQSYDDTAKSLDINSIDQKRFDDAKSIFQLRHEELKTKPEALAEAQSMIRHQLLELYYIQNSPQSQIARSSKQRGVSDDADEIRFYRLLSDYLASQNQTDTDYLLQYEMQARSELAPGKKSISLSNLRALVAEIYDRIILDTTAGLFTKEDADQFRLLRNSIHNGLKSAAIADLQKYLLKFQVQLDLMKMTVVIDGKDAEVTAETQIVKLIADLTAYYKLDTEIFSVLTKSLSIIFPDIKKVTDDFKAIEQGKLVLDLNTLSRLAGSSVKARQLFVTNKNIDLVHFIFRTSQVIQQELGKLSKGTNEEEFLKLKIYLQLSFSTGLVNQIEYSELMNLITTNQGSGMVALRNQLSVMISKYNEAFQPALSDWQLVSTSVYKFVEDGLRSTVLIQLDSLLNDLLQNSNTIDNPQSSNTTTTNYKIETFGLGYGYLRFVPKDKTEELTKTMTFKDIPIFESMPLDLGVVAGTITEQPQTPLSHVNMKSKDRKTPNMYFKSASKSLEFSKLLNKLVRLELTSTGYSIKETTSAEAEAFWLKLKSQVRKFKLHADLSEKRIRPTSEMGFKDVISVGAKAANYAEGTHVLPGVFRDGFAIPFFYYDDFLKTNYIDDTKKITIDQYIQKILANTILKNNRVSLIQQLELIQSRIRSSATTVSPQLLSEVRKIVSAKYPGQKIRFRSSTNSEDMPGFTGAGLYTSEGYNPKHDDPNYLDKKTGKPPVVRKTIENALKTVWASVWNIRAWDEREHYGINHADVKMAMAVSPGFNELANGVGVSKNFMNPELGEGVYLNIQSEEDAVTNPDPSITPDQVLVLFKPDVAAKTKYTLKYFQYSSKTKTKPVLEYSEVEKITDNLRTLHKHFYKLYHPLNDNPNFSLDVEFKVDDVDVSGKSDGIRRVYYKQARPFGG